MPTEWYYCTEFKKFPLICRMWLWWCAHGPKRQSGGTLGGNKLFGIMERFLKVSPHNSTNYLSVYIAHCGLNLVVDLLDFETYQHTIPCVSRGTYGMMIQDMLLKSDSVFLDIGANHGIYTFCGSSLIGSDGRIVAAEPQPRLVEALLRSKNENGLEHIAIIASAVGAQIGHIDFFVPSGGSGVGSIIKSHASQSSSKTKQIVVNITTIDHIIQEENLTKVDLIKVDVEGGELQVFQGAKSTLLCHKPFLWFEVNPKAQSAAGIDPSSLLDFLAALGYGPFYELSSIAVGIEKEVKYFTKLTDVVAVHGDRIKEFRAILVNLAQKNITVSS